MFVNTFRIRSRSGGLFLCLWHFGPPKAGNGLILNRCWESMGYKGVFWGGMLRECQVGMKCRQTEHSFLEKMTGREGKFYVEC